MRLRRNGPIDRMHEGSRGWALLALALVGRISGRIADPHIP
jgi:hypothetical protein